MPELVEQKVVIGRDFYGRRVTATRRLEGGQAKWILECEPSSQRDEGERIFSLTDDNMRELVRALDVIRP